MRSGELRINNLVLYKWFDKNYINGKQRTVIHREVVKILAIDSVNNRVLIKTNQTRKNHTWVSIDAISPVPLTEERLLKCGFEDNKHRGYFLYTEQSSMICIYKDGSVKINDRYIDYKINHLHRLQNLYFEIADQELEIKF